MDPYDCCKKRNEGQLYSYELTTVRGHHDLSIDLDIPDNVESQNRELSARILNAGVPNPSLSDQSKEISSSGLSTGPNPAECLPLTPCPSTSRKRKVSCLESPRKPAKTARAAGDLCRAIPYNIVDTVYEVDS